MKPHIPASLMAALFAATLVHGAAADDVKTAAKKLTDAANYSWTATTVNAAPAAGGGGAGFNAGPVTGKTEKGGFTVITRSFNGNAMQTVSKDGKSAFQGQDGAWTTPEEMMAAMGGGGGAPGGGLRGFGAAPVLPADEIASLAAKVKELKSADGVLLGDLPADGVGTLLMAGRGMRGGAPGAAATPPAPPQNASGSIKIWLKDGVLAKYELHLKGTVTGRGGNAQEVDRTVTTEIKDIGSTKLDVPAEAKSKLEAKPAAPATPAAPAAPAAPKPAA